MTAIELAMAGTTKDFCEPCVDKLLLMTLPQVRMVDPLNFDRNDAICKGKCSKIIRREKFDYLWGSHFTDG